MKKKVCFVLIAVVALTGCRQQEQQEENAAAGFETMTVSKQDVASCALMSIGAVWSLVPFVRRKLPLVFSKGWTGMRQMLAIVANGSSEFFVSIAGSLFAVVVNIVLLRLGDSTAVAAAAIVEYVASLTGMVIHSMTDALQPAILIVRRARLQAPPSTPPVASFFQPTLSLDFIRPFLAMPKLKQVWLWSSGLTKTFNYRRNARV